jgi:ketosteroid isomerase-like protein
VTDVLSGLKYKQQRLNIKEMKHLLILVLIMTTACYSPSEKSTEKNKAAVIQTELDFAKMADDAGVAAAFYEFAADSAVIGRGGKIIKGREAIRDYYEKALKPGTRLQWAPDFADVSGDIGYTWGKYTHFVPDSTGKITESHGVFHTVWKRQPDGSWRFVWD